MTPVLAAPNALGLVH